MYVKIRTDVRTRIQRNHAILMNHFIPDDHEPGRLQNLVSEVVQRRKHARYEAARDAAAIDVEVLP
jgi:hypothetical protein